MDNKRGVGVDSRQSSLNQPLTKVVGFRVEGIPPSPSPHANVLGNPDLGPQTHVGSPSPVIIPPSFQTDSPIRQSDDDGRSSGLAHQHSGLHRHGSTISEQMAAMRDELPAAQQQLSVQRSAPPSPALPPRETPGGAGAQTGGEGGPWRTASDPVQLDLSEPAAAAAAMYAEATSAAAARSAALGSSPDASSAASGAYSSKGPVSTPPPTPGRSKSGARDGSKLPADQPPAQQPQQQRGPPPGEKPKPTRAERRELQDRQRAAKAAAKAAKEGGGGGPAPRPGAQRGVQATGSGAYPPPKQGSVDSQRLGSARTGRGGSAVLLPEQARPGSSAAHAPPPPSSAAAANGGLALFSHLPAHRGMSIRDALARCPRGGEVHPGILRLGLEYSSGEVRGADARCVAMLEQFKVVVQDYRTPEGKTLQRDLVAHLSTQVSFLVECRPLGTAMGNAIKYIKRFVTHLDGRLGEADAKEQVLDMIDSYVKDKIIGCTKVLVDKALSKIADGDVVLTYALSSVVLQLLLRAKKEGRRFRVVVVDSRPLLEGREALRRLLAAGISATYCYISGLGYIVKESTKVFLGAAAVLANGTVISRVGSAMVAMTAAAHHVPVMVCAESHKFNERVQLDSITNNELGDPCDLEVVRGHPHVTGLQGWQDVPKLGVLNLMYDAMPCEYISMICTEFGSLPPSSVPVILRESREDWLPSAT